MLSVVTFLLLQVFLTDSACFYIGLFANGEAFDTTLRSLYTEFIQKDTPM